jgi:hypothetical protein
LGGIDSDESRKLGAGETTKNLSSGATDVYDSYDCGAGLGGFGGNGKGVQDNMTNNDKDVEVPYGPRNDGSGNLRVGNHGV